MIASFEKKLEEVKNNRKQAWKPVLDLKNEIDELGKQASEVEGFLSEMGIDSEQQKNVYAKKVEEKQQRLKTYAIHGTEIIDNALTVLTVNQACKKNLLGELSVFLDSKKKLSMHYDAAMVLAALSEREMKKCASYKECLLYKEYMKKAFTILINQGDAYIYYAQWGKIIYDVCLPQLVKEGDRTTAVQECKEAYKKFSNVTLAIPEIALHEGYCPGDEVYEVELLFLKNKKKYKNPQNVIRNLIDTSANSHRTIIKMYRYEVLEKAVMRMANTGTLLDSLKDEIIRCSDTFEGDVNKLFEKYHTVYIGAANGKKINALKDYMEERRYLNVLSQEYKWIDKTIYETDLKEVLMNAMNGVGADVVLDDEWFHTITKSFVEKRETDFNRWLEIEIKRDCVADYKRKVEKKVKTIQSVYDQKLLRGYATSNDILKEIEDKAWQNRWGCYIPESVFEEYYNIAEEKLKQKRQQEYGVEPIPTKKKSSNGFIKRVIDLCKEDINIAICVFGLVAFVLMGMGGVIWGGIQVISYFSALGNETFVEKTDDEIANDLINEIIRSTAELSETATSAKDFSYEQVNYFSTPCIYITKYNGLAETVEVPAVIDGMNVCGIAEGAFADNIYLKKVILPATIVSLDNRAFANCKQLEEVVCSSNLTNIYDFVFDGCSSLTSFVCDGDVSSLRTIGRNAFYGCTSLKSVDIQTEVYKSFSFGEGCFRECKNLSVVNVNGEKLENVIVGNNAFDNCIVLTDVLFADKITEMGEYAFVNCASLESINLSKAVNIPNGAFQNCTTLTSFHVSNTVKEIGYDAFNSCTSLTTVTFDSVELPAEEDGYGIGHRAFSNTAITEIELPSQYNGLGSNVFGWCPKLTKFVWHNSGKNVATQFMGDGTFGESHNIKEVYLPRTISSMSDLGCSNRSAVTIYAMEGSVPHTYAIENGYVWAVWTE